MPRYAMYIDVGRCIGCYACVVGCNNWHEDDGHRIRIMDTMKGKYPDVSRWIFPIFCMQCENAPCINACPEDAIYKEDGIVVINEDKCIGCGECKGVCPYGAIYIDEERGRAIKCDLCLERIKKGLNPFCVDVCPTDALLFGDLDDPEDRSSDIILSKKKITLLSDKGRGAFGFYPNIKELNDIVLQANIKG